MSAVRRPVGLTAAAMLAVGGLSLVPSTVAGGAPNGCTPEYKGQLPAGAAVTGKVTTSGSTPDAITGTYVGTLKNAVGPGKDLLLFDLAGSRITNADGDVDAGIWAGMSGSPLYADSSDAGTAPELVGAVSYGFSIQSSTYAGVTPAKDVYGADKSRVGANAAAIPQGLRQRLQADGVSARAVQSGLRRLRIPRAVAANTSRDRLNGLARKTGFAAKLAQAGSGGGVSALALPAPVPGSAIATSAFYGAVDYTGVGTVTEVCNNKVFAFGHPDSLTGPSTLTMHAAQPIAVQKDDTFGSYVLANVGLPIGRLTQDRTSGIVGQLGSPAPLTKVRTSTTVLGVGKRPAQSFVSIFDALPFAVDAQATGEVDGLYDGSQRCTADVSWRITGKHSNGKPFSFTRTNRVADRYDISSVVGSDVTSDLMAITDNEFEDVTVTDVLLMNTVNPRYYAYRIALVQAKQRGRWVAVADGSRVRAKPGKRVVLRLTLLPQRGSSGGVKRITVRTKIPKKLRGQRALLQVAGLADSYGGFDDEEFSEDGEVESGLETSSEPTSFSGVLAALRTQNRNDLITTTLTAGGDKEEEEGEGGPALVRQKVLRAPSVTTGSRTLIVKVNR